MFISSHKDHYYSPLLPSHTSLLDLTLALLASSSVISSFSNTTFFFLCLKLVPFEFLGPCLPKGLCLFFMVTIF